MERSSTSTRTPDPVAGRCTALLASYVASGDRSRFDELALLATPGLRRRAATLMARFGLRADESDIVQETLLNVFRYARTFRPSVDHAFSTWSARIVRNVVLRQLRRQRQRPTISLDALDGFDVAARPGADPALVLAEAEDRAEMVRGFRLWLQVYLCSYQTLTDLQKRVLHCVEVLGYTYREVGCELGMRVDAVKMVVYRARKRLSADVTRAAAG
jgi:RNA polymerase sigma factor (sigma-70 family)